MNEWIKIARLSEIQEGFGKYIELGEVQIALFLVAGQIYATDNLCPHQTGPLSAGDINGTLVTCPWHGWEFDISTGQCTHIPNTKVKIFETKIEGDNVHIKL